MPTGLPSVYVLSDTPAHMRREVQVSLHDLNYSHHLLMRMRWKYFRLATGWGSTYPIEEAIEALRVLGKNEGRKGGKTALGHGVDLASKS